MLSTNNFRLTEYLNEENLLKCLNAFRDNLPKFTASGLKIYIDGRRINEDFERFLPQDGHHCLNTYKNYMEGVCSEFLIYYPKIESILLDIQDHFLPFTPFEKNSNHQFDFEFFIGKYAHTPGGVHREHCTNCHFVAFGKKQLKIFTHDLISSFNTQNKVQKNITSDDLEYFLDLSNEQIEGLPCLIYQLHKGCMIQMAPLEWHVGKSPEFSAGVNCAVYQKAVV